MVKVLDFGISKVKDADVNLTRPGEVIGTPFYMAPEQARGDQTIDHRADLFALGAVFYEALTGVPPFDGDTPNSILRSILLEDIPDPKVQNPALTDAVCDVLRKALAKERNDRYQSGALLAEGLAMAARGGVGVESERAVPSAETPPRVETGPKAVGSGPGQGFKTIHLILAFVLGALIFGGGMWLILLLS